MYPDLDTIYLAPDQIFSVTDSEYDSPSTGGRNAFPVIDSLVTIRVAGVGTTATIVNESETAIRFFEISSNGQLYMEDVTLRGGSAQWGGAIYNDGYLGIDNAVLEDNIARGEDGGISGDCSTTPPIESCDAGGGGGGGAGMGGAIFNDVGAGADISRVTLRDNRATGGDGAPGFYPINFSDTVGGSGGGPFRSAGSVSFSLPAEGGFGSGGGGGGGHDGDGGEGGYGGYGGGAGGGGSDFQGCGGSCNGFGGTGGFAGGAGGHGIHSGSGGGGGGGGLGGAVANFGNMGITDSLFAGNIASGGNGGDGRSDSLTMARPVWALVAAFSLMVHLLAFRKLAHH